MSLTSIDDLNLLKNLSNLVYIDPGSIYTLSETSPTEVSGSYEFENNYLNLNGTNVLVGIIDSGIDYLNREFSLEDDTTRIVSIWDQTLGYDKENQIMGSIFSEEDINKAIIAKKQGLDPYSIVPSTDNIGHGTSMASIIGARGYNPAVKGIASDCKYSIVKLREITSSYLDVINLKDNIPKFRDIDIILALNYLKDTSKKLQLPLVVCLPLSSNMGSHDGRSILEYYINQVSTTGGNIVATSTGNEGNTQTHAGGYIEGINLTEEIELNIGQFQNSLVLNLYVASPQTVTLTIISPAGQVFNNLSFKFSNYELGDLGLPLNFIYENTKLYVKFISPDTLTGDEKIIIWSNNMKKGIWKFLLTGNYDIRSKYDAWIFQKDLLDSETKFLTSNSNSTLTLPGTSELVITTSYYNQNSNSILSDPGRGFTRDGLIKPLIASPGLNIVVTTPNDGIAKISGGSAAAAILSGVCSLFLDWGITKKNKPNITALSVQTYLIRGASRREGDTYPNKNWGYGTLSLKGIFDSLIRGDSSFDDTNLNLYDEYYVGNLFIRIPKI